MSIGGTVKKVVNFALKRARVSIPAPSERQRFRRARQDFGDQIDLVWTGFSGFNPMSYGSSHKDFRQYRWAGYVVDRIRMHGGRQHLDVASWLPFSTALATCKDREVTMIDIRDNPVRGQLPMAYRKEDVCSMSFYAETFDSVSCWQVLHHIGINWNQPLAPFKISKAFIEISRVLKSGGYGIFVTYVKQGKPTILFGCARVSTPDEVAGYVSDAGLEMVDERYVSGQDFRDIAREEIRHTVNVRSEADWGDYMFFTVRKPVV